MRPIAFALAVQDRLDALDMPAWSIGFERHHAATGSVYLTVTATPEEDEDGSGTRTVTVRIADHEPNLDGRRGPYDDIYADTGRDTPASVTARICQALGLGRPRYRLWRVVGLDGAYRTRAEAEAAAREWLAFMAGNVRDFDAYVAAHVKRDRLR